MKQIMVIFALFFFWTCQSDTAHQTAENEATTNTPKEPDTGTLPVPPDSVLINQVKENLEGLNNEDIGWAINPLHTNSPYMQDPGYHVQGSFMVYDMKFRLVSVKIESKSERECVALVEHDSENMNERDYTPQRQKQRYTWRPDGPLWKIYKIEVIGSTPL